MTFMCGIKSGFGLMDPDPDPSIFIINLLEATPKLLLSSEKCLFVYQSFLDVMYRTVLWNRNYFLRFRFRHLNSYGSGSCSDF